MVKYRFIFLLSVLFMFVAVISYAAKDEATLEGNGILTTEMLQTPRAKA